MRRDKRDSELDWLLQTRFRSHIVTALGEREWITVYDRFDGDRENGGLFSAVLPTSLVDTALADSSTDLSPSGNRPGCSVLYDGDAKTVLYDRFGQSDGIEPFIVHRSFNMIRPAYQEILEEFRLFHNLYHEDGSPEYIMIDSDGDEHVVIRAQPDRIEVRIHQLRQFLALKESHLAVYFDRVRDASTPYDEVPGDERQCEYRDGLTRYSFHAHANDGLRREHKTLSRVLGKKLIPPLPKDKSKMWPYDEPEDQYETFVIGVDADEESIEYTCEPEELANYFGANPHAPHHLTPVFFRREVLTKYYSEPRRYEVRDGHLFCGDLWGLRLDNNHSDYVIVFLGDLGQCLSYREQGYWKSFNIPPDGTISDVNFRRGFLAEPTNPERADLLFKQQYSVLQERWCQERGWQIFRTLVPEDQHCFKSLHIPLAEDQRQFDEQVLNLTKLLVDSLNEAELKARAGDLPDEPKGIDKFEGFLREEGCASTAQTIEFLRALQDLRSAGVAHLKGRRYEKSRKRLGLDSGTFRESFESILSAACEVLLSLLELAEQGEKRSHKEETEPAA